MGAVLPWLATCITPSGWVSAVVQELPRLSPAPTVVGRAVAVAAGFGVGEYLVGGRLVDRGREQRHGRDLDPIGAQGPAVRADAVPPKRHQPQGGVVGRPADDTVDVAG